MKAKTYTFEVHKYAPELNKIYYRGVDVTKHFSDSVKRSLGSSYQNNLRIVRGHLNKPVYDHYITIRFKGTDKYEFTKEKSGGFNSPDYPRVIELYKSLHDWFTLCTPENLTHFSYFYLKGYKKQNNIHF